MVPITKNNVNVQRYRFPYKIVFIRLMFEVPSSSGNVDGLIHMIIRLLMFKFHPIIYDLMEHFEVRNRAHCRVTNANDDFGIRRHLFQILSFYTRHITGTRQDTTLTRALN
eukprot:CAMPEP_0197542080 /NCGR_PEP_ID=MMETSP1318-20131121/67402_1 /TAXON_ID=552666 /ORGANISM="Partenskyella glossopodia, Strain RCC365" /LENGTH=110 /DNA_ID=CAMNT_0043101321 /DNA_START=791 /DNA_END=1123 /DNA_ORIENTATION=-